MQTNNNTEKINNQNFETNHPKDQPVDWVHKRKYLIIFGIALFLGVLSLASYYSYFLSARVAPGLRFRVTGPSTLLTGAKATITWDTSTENRAKYPYQKIEWCYGRVPKVKCVLLASSAVNNGKAIVNVPASIPTSTGYIKLTPRDQKKFLRFGLTFKSKTLKPQTAGTGGDGSGGGSKNSGGGGGGNNNNTANNSNTNSSNSTPTPTDPTLTMANICFDGSPASILASWEAPVEYRPVSGGGISFRYREKGTSNWIIDSGSGGAYEAGGTLVKQHSRQAMGKTTLTIKNTSSDNNLLKQATKYEFAFFSDDSNKPITEITTVDTGSLPGVNAGCVIVYSNGGTSVASYVNRSYNNAKSIIRDVLPVNPSTERGATVDVTLPQRLISVSRNSNNTTSCKGVLTETEANRLSDLLNISTNYNDEINILPSDSIRYRLSNYSANTTIDFRINVTKKSVNEMPANLANFTQIENELKQISESLCGFSPLMPIASN